MLKKRRVVLFTSLPRVGGHSTITLGLARIFRTCFDEIEIWCKTMPEHGHSETAAAELSRLGCRVVMLTTPAGRTRPVALARAVLSAALRPPDLFFTLAMKNLSPVLARLVRAKHSIYYHITHDLNPDTVAFLNRCARAFSQVLFICPATYEQFPGAAEKAGKFGWVPQLSEIPVTRGPELIASRDGAAGKAVRLGLIGRLTEAKGAAVMLEFVKSGTVPCELHVAGAGPLEKEFLRLAETNAGRPVKVVFHGSYDPSTRAEFLFSFFRGIDWLVVPSQDEWETLSMAVLESLQHGVPALVCNTGGLGSFGHPDLGPAPDDIVRLVGRDKLPAAMASIVSGGESCSAEKAGRCMAHYEAYFSNKKIAAQWLAIPGIAPRDS